MARRPTFCETSQVHRQALLVQAREEIWRVDLRHDRRFPVVNGQVLEIDLELATDPVDPE